MPTPILFRQLLTALVLCTAVASGCGETAPPAPSGPDELPPDAIRLTIGPVELKPGQETTRCITGHLPTGMPIDVVGINTKQTLSHHVIFYRYRPGVEQADAPISPCLPLDVVTNGNRAPLFIGETPDAGMMLPPGVGYHFAPGAPYTVEGHFLNATLQTVSATAEVVLLPARPGTAVTQADMLFFSSTTPLFKSYDASGRDGLPPRKETTLPAAFMTVPDDVKVFGLTSHQHRLGSRFVIGKSTDADVAGERLYENTDWEHPPLLRFPDDKLLTFKPGEGLRWQCTYNNTSDRYVTFGPSAERDEMCILWGYYYPAQGFLVYFL